MKLTDAKSKVIQQIEYIESLLATQCIEKCNYVVRSGIYTIGTDEKGVVKVDIYNLTPTQFTFEAGSKLLNFNARNERGQLSWELVKSHDYHVNALEELKGILDIFNKNGI